MDRVVLRTNAVPLYGFLSAIMDVRSREGMVAGAKILDCGAGGPVLPLALFCQRGLESWGIDISKDQLAKAMQFCQEQEIELDLRKGDMRCIPFQDKMFDYVYEHYAMCHLSKRDTAQAVAEMYRVLKVGGMCFLGVISADTWPRSLFGQEREPGAYWGKENGETILHTVFDDAESAPSHARDEARDHSAHLWSGGRCLGM